MAEKGTVYLVGAGPGDPEQLTVRAHRLICQADCVFHDDLVPPAILALAHADAEVVSVGKRCGSKSISQSEINQALISQARAGLSVVRLKSGDPLLFGRAGEELEALRLARIPIEIVAGVSTAFAAAGELQVSLTDRRLASKVIFLTAHRAEDSIAPVWSGPLPEDATLAIYMPGPDYGRLGAELIACGLPRTMAAVVISRVGSAEQRMQRSILGQLSEVETLPAPAILLVGRVFADYAGPA